MKRFCQRLGHIFQLGGFFFRVFCQKVCVIFEKSYYLYGRKTNVSDWDKADSNTGHMIMELQYETLEEIRKTGGNGAAQEYLLEATKAMDKAKNYAGRRENKAFTQLYQRGWDRLQMLMKKDANAARVYAFFAEHMGPDGTLCASRGTIAEALDITERTVSRHIKTLSQSGAIVILKMGTANVYCLNPEEVWKSFDNAKPYAAFNTKALVSKTENPFVKKRLATLLNGKIPSQPDMFENQEETLRVESE